MPQGRVSGAAGQTRTGELPARTAVGRGRIVLLVAVLAAILAGAIGYAVYLDQIAPYRRSVVEVNGQPVSMGYFLKRVKASGRQPLEVLDTLIKDEIVKQVATAEPYNIRIADEDIDTFLRTVAASGQQTAPGDAEFQQWYRQQLNESRLSESDYRDTVSVYLLRQRLAENLVDDAAGAVPQVRLSMIPLQTLEAARKAERMLRSGEDFTAVAKAMSADEKLGQRGGDIGWVPRSALAASVADMAFGALRPGEVSPPLPRVDGQGFLIIMVSDGPEDRPLDPSSRSLIAMRILDQWLSEQFDRHDVAVHGLDGGYDSRTDAWVRQQLQRMTN